MERFSERPLSFSLKPRDKAKIAEALWLSRSTPQDQKSLRAALLKWASVLPAISYLLACANESAFFGNNPVWELLRGTGAETRGVDLPRHLPRSLALQDGLPFETACECGGISKQTGYDWLKRGDNGEEPFLTLS